MVKSYRGKEIDMVSLAKKNEKTVALGNAHMNGRGDILGRGGKIIETREETLKKYYDANTFQQASVNLKNNEEENKQIENSLKTFAEETFDEVQSLKVSKPKKVKETISETLSVDEKKEKSENKD